MRLTCSEQIAVKLPPGSRQAIAAVAARREISRAEFVRTLVLSGLQRATGESATRRARELGTS